MATKKYAFNSGLKELRFLFCQTSEHSAPVRYATSTDGELPMLAHVEEALDRLREDELLTVYTGTFSHGATPP